MYKINIRTYDESSETYLYISEEQVDGEHSSYDGKLNEISYFDFRIYRGMPGYDSIDRYRTYVTVFKADTDEVVYDGRICGIDCTDEDEIAYKTVTCEDAIAYLRDSVIDLHTGGEYIVTAGGRDAQKILNKLIDNHNAVVQQGAAWAEKLFRVKYCAAGTLPEYVDLDYVSTYEAIQKLYVRDMEWDVKIEPATDNGITYNDITIGPDLGEVSNTAIEVGENMISISASGQLADGGLVTRIRPLGGIGHDGNRLTIKSIPQTVDGETVYLDYIDNAELVAKYGVIEAVMLYEEITEASPEEQIIDATPPAQALYDRAKAAADKLDEETVSVNVRGVDLSVLGYDADSFEVGNRYRITNAHINFDRVLRLIAKKYTLAEPHIPELVFGAAADTLTSSSARRSDIVNTRIYNVNINSYSVLDGRMDGMSLRDTDTDNFAPAAKDLSVVEQTDGALWLYKGDKRIVVTEGGGGAGAAIEYAAVIAEQEQKQWIPEHELIPVFYNSGCAAYYGGAPSRMVVQGNRVLFNVPYADITPEDISSDVHITSNSGDKYHLQAYIYSQNASSITLDISFRKNDVLVNTSYYRALYYLTPSQISTLTFGIVLDLTTITESAYQGRYVETLMSFTCGNGSSRDILLAAFQDGELIIPYSVNTYNLSWETRNRLMIYDDAEWNFDVACSKRFEPEVT